MADNVSTLDHELNQMILSGKILEAFEKFYAEDVTMQENAEPVRSGKAANLEYEKQFLGSIEQFHGAKVLGSAVEGDRSYSQWEMDVTFKGGHHAVMNQVAARTWKNGQIASERFYYSK